MRLGIGCQDGLATTPCGGRHRIGPSVLFKSVTALFMPYLFAGLTWWLVILLCTVTMTGHAADGEVVTQRAELEAVQRRIAELERSMAETESSRSDAAQRLVQAERAVSAANRQLRQLAQERDALTRELAQVEAEQGEVERRVARRQTELEAWLRRHYIHGGGDIAPLLSGRDPNQLARDVRYLEHLGRARLELIAGLREDLRAQIELAESIAGRRQALVAIEAEQHAQKEALDKTLASRAVALEQLAERLVDQRAEASGLRANEQRLGRVVETLQRQAVERKAAERARIVADPREVASGTSPAARTPSGPRRTEPVTGRGTQLAGPTPTGVRFSQLRGQMGFPVRGELIGRFGAQRAEGGTRWRGVFIRASGGEEVMAVASGEVVFSDWMRGYGNLIILDHGDDYLTIYGNNDALFKVVGESIPGGTPIASVGVSGGAQESGLYFEVRHKGEPVDPMQWIRAR